MSGENFAQTGWSRPRRRRRAKRAQVNYEEMSVRYGSVKLQLPKGFKSLLEHLTREILREQPKNIPEFAAAYFKHLLQKREDGSYDASYLVNERVVDAPTESEAPAVEEPSYDEPVVPSTPQADEVTPSMEQSAEEMPDLNDPKVEEAATKIQASFRGFQVRKSLSPQQAPTNRELAFLRNQAGQSTSSVVAEDTSTAVINNAVLTVDDVTTGDERRDSSSSLCVVASETTPDILQSLAIPGQRRHSDAEQPAPSNTSTRTPKSSPALTRPQEAADDADSTVVEATDTLTENEMSLDPDTPRGLAVSEQDAGSNSDATQQNGTGGSESGNVDDVRNELPEQVEQTVAKIEEKAASSHSEQRPVERDEAVVSADLWVTVEQTPSVEMASVAAEIGSLPDDSLPEVNTISEEQTEIAQASSENKIDDLKTDATPEKNQSEAAEIMSENLGSESVAEKADESPEEVQAKEEEVQSEAAGISTESQVAKVEESSSQQDVAYSKEQQEDDDVKQKSESTVKVAEAGQEIDGSDQTVEAASEERKLDVESEKSQSSIHQQDEDVEPTQEDTAPAESQQNEEVPGEAKAQETVDETEEVQGEAVKEAEVSEAAELLTDEKPAAEETAVVTIEEAAPDAPAPEADAPAPEADAPAPEAEAPAPEADAPVQEVDAPAQEADVPSEEAASDPSTQEAEAPAQEASPDDPAQADEPPTSQEAVTESAEIAAEEQATGEAAEPPAESSEKTNDAPAESQEVTVSMAEQES